MTSFNGTINRVELMGRLGADPELEHGGADKIAHCTFRIATERPQGKDKPNVTTWVPIHVWRAAGEAAAKYLVKGQRVLVEAHLQINHWQTETGEARSRIEVVADNIIYLEKPGQAATNAPEETTAEE